MDEATPGPETAPSADPDPASAAGVDVVGVDGQHLVVRVTDGVDVPLDVCFDDRRVWSFWSSRDTKAGPGGDRRVAWPPPLRHHLDGVTRLCVREHVSGRVLHDQEQRFGTSDARVAFVNSEGAPLGIDKSGRAAVTFDTRSEADVAPLLDAVDEVLAALRTLDIDAFVAYGTLLGAVRQGSLIGHDSDADLGYVSRHTDPADVCRESFALQRHLDAMGYETQRYSGCALQVFVTEGDGTVRGLDIFGGFLTGGVLYLMGEVGHPFEEEWLRPLGTADLEGRPVPVPARPEKLLEAMYGESWRVPDPAFKFETPAHVHRALNGWFRGTRVHRNDWARRYSGVRRALPGPCSDLARLVLERETDPGRLVDLGTGRGSDALHWARAGFEVTAYDYMPWGSLAAVETARAEGLSLEFVELNLQEWRSAMAIGAREAHRPGHRTLVARHLADAMTRPGRDSLWRLSSMALRSGGRLYVENWVGGPPLGYPGERRLRTADVVAELESHGATVVHVEELAEPLAPDPTRSRSQRSTEMDQTQARTVGRVVAQWHA